MGDLISRKYLLALFKNKCCGNCKECAYLALPSNDTCCGLVLTAQTAYDVEEKVRQLIKLRNNYEDVCEKITCDDIDCCVECALDRAVQILRGE